MEANLVQLLPGDWYFGSEPKVVSTLLGSCVAVTVWHPQLHCGGMCHYLLAKQPKANPLLPPNPRYGVDVLELLRCKMLEFAPIKEFWVGCFGGAQMFIGNADIGRCNATLAMQWVALHRLQLCRHELGGNCGRKIRLNLCTGNVDVVLLASGLGLGLEAEL